MAHETILLEDEGTWPKEIYGLVAPNAAQIHQELELERRQSMAGKSWLSTIGESKYKETRARLGFFLRQHTVRAYHCARVLDTERVLREGLSPLDMETMVCRVYAALEASLGPADALRAKALLQDYAARADNTGSPHLLWFYLTEGQTTDDACRALLEYYGGEAARNALHGQRFRYYPLLRRVGAPAIFECRVQLADGSDEQVESLAGQVLRRIINRETGNPAEPIRAELSIRKPVLPGDITALNGAAIT